MKKFVGVAMTLMFLGFAQISDAQSKVERGAKKVGNKTAEVASKGKAKITDQVYADKVAANGATVYMDNHSRYYWVDKKGRRHYVTEASLKAKVDD